MLKFSTVGMSESLNPPVVFAWFTTSFSTGYVIPRFPNETFFYAIFLPTEPFKCDYMKVQSEVILNKARDFRNQRLAMNQVRINLARERFFNKTSVISNSNSDGA